MTGNYARHAQYWDWGGIDRAPEHDYWYNYAIKYGNNILIPMCALGETGVYMAERGLNVTAFDITPEMIAEGKNRFGHVPGLRLHVGDVCNFSFDIPSADFCFCTDFGHLLTIQDVKKALTCIHNHMRDGGGLVIETGLRMPGTKPNSTPLQTYHPKQQIYPGLKVWKTGQTRTEADTGHHYISQTFYAQDASGHVDSFSHEFCLRLYTREAWLEAFEECGFMLTGEYTSREGESWQSGGSGYRIFEACVKNLCK